MKPASPRKSKGRPKGSSKVRSKRKSKATLPRRGHSVAPADGRVTLAPDVPLAPDDRVVASNLTLHELFAQQTVRMLERADLSEEQKQSLLIGMSCPCCGAGGFSFTAKLKR